MSDSISIEKKIDIQNSILQNELKYVKGIGPKRAESLNNVGIYTLKDLITYFPTGYINRESAGSVAELRQSLLAMPNLQLSTAVPNAFATATNPIPLLNSSHFEVSIIGKIMMHNIRKIRNSRKKMLIINVKDMKADAFEMIFFSSVEYFLKIYPIGTLIVVSGRPTLNEINKRAVTFSHPEIDIIEEDDIEYYGQGGILPKYKITEDMRKSGVSIRSMRRIVNTVLDNLEAERISLDLLETLPETLRTNNNLLPIEDAILTLHRPQNFDQIDAARYRIKFEEIFWYQIILNITHSKIKTKEKGIIIAGKSRLARELYDSLLFELTIDQKKALNDFHKDFISGKPMNRLLQGDVGAGKTIVAILAMLMVIDAGYQVVLMVPTEILAEQHFLTISNLLHNIELAETSELHNITLDLLLGATKKSQRNAILERIESGATKIIIGTHSLFQSGLKYNNLGFVVIDEQHRFGVSQRAELIELARNSMFDITLSPHILFMTATPIPRTLTMTLYGDLDVSIIKSQHKNRMPIKTRVTFETEREQLYGFIETELEKGRQVYIVYPLVEKSDKLELKAATEHFEIIRTEIFPTYKCGLLHGQMKWQDKEQMMLSFKRNEFQVIVTTVVVEVGIDVPNATVMVIEDAYRFGLSQLHQLRGRVGRGKEQSYCFLMTKDDFKFKFSGRSNMNIEEEKINAIIRLKAMQDIADGFNLSEIDLKLRGPGDMVGTKQSGLPNFKYVNLVNDVEVIQIASSIAKEIAIKDPNLEHLEHSMLKEYFQKNLKLEKNFINIA